MLILACGFTPDGEFFNDSWRELCLFYVVIDCILKFLPRLSLNFRLLMHNPLVLLHIEVSMLVSVSYDLC